MPNIFFTVSAAPLKLLLVLFLGPEDEEDEDGEDEAPAAVPVPVEDDSTVAVDVASGAVCCLPLGACLFDLLALRATSSRRDCSSTSRIPLRAPHPHPHINTTE